MTLVCAYCESECEKHSNNQKYCSKTCKNRAAIRKNPHYYRDYYRANLEQERARGRQRRLDDLDGYRRQKREEFHRLKREVVDGYGGKCECCGETHIEFLTIDHIFGDGAEERKHTQSSTLYRRLRKEGYPKGRYRVLCMNCNWAIRFGATCPHKLGQWSTQSAA